MWRSACLGHVLTTARGTASIQREPSNLGRSLWMVMAMTLWYQVSFNKIGKIGNIQCSAVHDGIHYFSYWAPNQLSYSLCHIMNTTAVTLSICNTIAFANVCRLLYKRSICNFRRCQTTSSDWASLPRWSSSSSLHRPPPSTGLVSLWSCWLCQGHGGQWCQSTAGWPRQ